MTHNHELPFTAEQTIRNLSSYKLSQCEQDILKYGLKFGVPPSRKVAVKDIAPTFESVNNLLTLNLKNGVNRNEVRAELSALAHEYCASYEPSRQALKKHAILKRLRNNKNIVICKPDKGNSVVILNRIDYERRLLDIINDRTKFMKRNRISGRKKDRDLTIFREGQLQRYLYSLKKKGLLSDNVYKKVYPKGSIPARIYGLPKMHKLPRTEDPTVVVPPVRPIVSSIGSYNYNLAKFLTSILGPHVPMDHCAADSFTFVNDLKQVSSQNRYMVSFDVVSLFTNIPLKETVNLAVDLVLAKNSNIKMSKAQLRKLFHFATSQTHFLFNGEYYDQVDGVAMGSPLGPVLANLFMSVHEKKWLHHYQGPPVRFYKRYVDDIFLMFDCKDHAYEFLEYLNKQHPCIKFTVEDEQNGKIPFLDVLVSKLECGQFHTTTYRKPTNTGLLTNFTSFCSFSYKVGLIKTLVDRAYKINSGDISRDTDLSFISKVLQRNLFPQTLIRKVMSSYKEPITAISSALNTNPSDKTKEKRFFKLPFIGAFSSLANKKLLSIVKKYCNDEIDVKFIFETCKIGQYFSSKDSVPKSLISHVVYHFSCASCGACYIGETARHFEQRVDEHLRTDTSSAIYKHLKENNACKRLCNNDCFSILDRGQTKWELKVKEAAHIKLRDPLLNKQVDSYKMKLLL